MAAVDGMALPYLARDPEDLSGHQNATEKMVQEGHTDNEIVAVLAQRGLITSGRSL
jgi:hypothetical protein